MPRPMWRFSGVSEHTLRGTLVTAHHTIGQVATPAATVAAALTTTTPPPAA